MFDCVERNYSSGELIDGAVHERVLAELDGEAVPGVGSQRAGDGLPAPDVLRLLSE